MTRMTRLESWTLTNSRKYGFWLKICWWVNLQLITTCVCRNIPHFFPFLSINRNQHIRITLSGKVTEKSFRWVPSCYKLSRWTGEGDERKFCDQFFPRPNRTSKSKWNSLPCHDLHKFLLLRFWPRRCSYFAENLLWAWRRQQWYHGHVRAAISSWKARWRLLFIFFASKLICQYRKQKAYWIVSNCGWITLFLCWAHFGKLILDQIQITRTSQSGQR